MICVSCSSEFTSYFCPECGEKSEVKKITLKSIVLDAFSTLTTMDKGFLYNFKMLFIYPKEITTSYILGKRRNILNPISYLIFTVTIYLLFESLLDMSLELHLKKEPPENYIAKVAFMTGRYTHQYFKYFWISSIFPLAIATKLVFQTYNFTEHLAINAFILAQASLVGLIGYIISRTDMVVNPLVYFTILWLVYSVFLTSNEKLSAFFKSFVVILFFIVQLTIIAFCVGLIMAKGSAFIS